MSLRPYSLGALLVFTALAVASDPVSSLAGANDPVELIVSVQEAEAVSGQQDVRIPVQMSNFFDTVAGFEMWVTVDRPDLVTLRLSLDTAGTLVRGWEFVGTNYVGGNSDTLRIFAMADTPSPLPRTHGIGFPQFGSIPLLFLRADIRDFRDSLDPQITAVILPTNDPGHFQFSNQAGVAIGLGIDSVADTIGYNCSYWSGDTCLLWNQLGGPPWDSIDVIWTKRVVVDTEKVKVTDGVLHISPATCGDVSGGDGAVNLADITALIGYVYLAGAPLPNLWAANVDGSADGKVNLSDITYLISSVYLGGNPPACL